MSTKQHKIGLCRRIIAFTLAFGLAIPININLSMQQPETVYADGIDTDAGAHEIATVIVNGIGSDGSGGNKKIPNGVSNARTGYGNWNSRSVFDYLLCIEKFIKTLRIERVFMLFFLFLAKQHGSRILRL